MTGLFSPFLPFLTKEMLKESGMILDVKGASNQHCVEGGRGMRELTGFLRKYPKTFVQDCSLVCTDCMQTFFWLVARRKNAFRGL